MGCTQDNPFPLRNRGFFIGGPDDDEAYGVHLWGDSLVGLRHTLTLRGIRFAQHHKRRPFTLGTEAWVPASETTGTRTARDDLRPAYAGSSTWPSF